MTSKAKKITPQNPATTAPAETTETTNADRKTAGFIKVRKTAMSRIRKTARKTSGAHFGG